MAAPCVRPASWKQISRKLLNLSFRNRFIERNLRIAHTWLSKVTQQSQNNEANRAKVTVRDFDSRRVWVSFSGKIGPKAFPAESNILRFSSSGRRPKESSGEGGWSPWDQNNPQGQEPNQPAAFPDGWKLFSSSVYAMRGRDPFSLVKGIWSNYMAFVLVQNKTGGSPSHVNYLRIQQIIQKAIVHVSEVVSLGNFDELEGLLNQDLISKLRTRYEELTPHQRMDLAIKYEDVMNTLFDGWVISEDASNPGRKRVEVKVIVRGVHGYGSLDFVGLREAMVEGLRCFAANYRFFRLYNNQGPESDWVISDLNHLIGGRWQDHPDIKY